MEVKVIGQMDNTIDHTFESTNRVYDKEGISLTINTCGGGGLQPKIIDDTYANRQPKVYEDYSPALRSEREGLKTIETISTKGKQIEVASTILAGYERTNMTGFNADNGVVEVKQLGFMDNGTAHNGSGTFGVIEPQLVGGIGEKWGDKQYRQGNRVYDSESVAMAVTSQPLGNMGGNSYMYLTREPQYRIRKLTPRECWRLMDFTDEDFEKAAQVNSNTQLYKQAGNSIVKNVLVAIIGQMLPGKEDVYKKLETR